MDPKKAVDLDNLNAGAIGELFAVEFQKLLDNIDDYNTKPDAPREIVIRVRVVPDKTRRVATSRVEVSAKLAKPQPHESFLFFEREAGKITAYPDDPNQGSLGIEDPAPGAARVLSMP